MTRMEQNFENNFCYYLSICYKAFTVKNIHMLQKSLWAHCFFCHLSVHDQNLTFFLIFLVIIIKIFFLTFQKLLQLYLLKHFHQKGTLNFNANNFLLLIIVLKIHSTNFNCFHLMCSMFCACHFKTFFYFLCLFFCSAK